MVPPSTVTKVKISTFPDPLVRVGAVAAAQSTVTGQVAVLSDESYILFNVNAPPFPAAGGLLNTKVTLPPDAVC